MNATTHHNSKAAKVTWHSRLQSVRSLWRFLGLLWRASPALFVVSITLRVVRSAQPLVNLWITRYIVDSVIRAAIKHTGRASDVFKLIALDAAVYVSGDLLRRLSILVESIFGDLFSIATNLMLMKHTAALDLGRFEDPDFSDRLERARQQSSGRLTIFTSMLNLTQDVLGVALLSSGLLFSSPLLLALLLFSILPAFFGEAKLAAMEYSVFFRRTPYRRKLDYIRFLTASIQTAKEVSLFALGSHLIERYVTEWKAIHSENKAIAIKRAWLGTIINLVPTAGYYCGYFLILLRTLSGAFSVGSFVFLIRAFSRSCSIIERIFSTVGSIFDDSLLISDLFALLSAKPSLEPPRMNLIVRRPMLHGFEFRNVGFQYPGTGTWVLRNISFELRATEKVAIVGSNGAGKSTITKLLARLYDPTEGQILLDGVDLRDYDIADLRKNITAVFQDHVRYDLTVTDNIGFGDIGRAGDPSAIEAAARKSHSHNLIESLPSMYDQLLGRRFEGGMDISGGEWQKLALARATMRDAQLWILDEPTASLDARAEYQWFMNFLDTAVDRSVLLISHRFTTIRMAERIFVLGQGTIREQGTHEDLLALNGRYAKLFHRQAAAYR
ncbi:MAG TPA: ABC transporter ATP-binding protein [Candidatus Angelobacter sp.]|nr:ABC transporter ATP-binding protein [Candidatus Angelobacter sp.]